MREPRKHSFDPECLTLAKHFLPGACPPRLVNELAQTIQDAVELWIDIEIAERMFEREIATRQ